MLLGLHTIIFWDCAWFLGLLDEQTCLQRAHLVVVAALHTLHVPEAAVEKYESDNYYFTVILFYLVYFIYLIFYYIILFIVDS